MKVKAIIWDFDGTLVDTGKKNFIVTQKIFKSIPNYTLPFKLTPENYQKAASRSKNWRDLYLQEFDMNEQQTDLAGKLWTQFQLEDTTPITFYPGLNLFLQKTADIPQGIVSQNSRQNIIKIIKENDLDHFFTSIIGYEEVNLHHQKPHPEGILKCIQNLGITTGKIIYIGDHETDINTARNASAELEKNNKNINIYTIAAFYGNDDDPAFWQTRADYIANDVNDIYKYLKVIEKI